MGNRKAILYIGNFLSSSTGIRYICEELSERLEKRGWSILRTSTFSGRLQKLVDMLKTAWSCRSSYSLAVVDVYSGNAFIWAEAVCRLLRFLRKPYVLSIRGGAMAGFARRWPSRVSHLLMSASLVTTPSLFLKDHLGTYRDDIQYLPNAIDIQCYPFRQRISSGPRLCWLRAFRDIYNPALAVRTLALLVKEFPAITLAMFGPDMKDGSLQKVQCLAEELKVIEHIKIHGALAKSKVPLVLNESDIFINTTRYESFGVAVMEAAADGLCIVSTNVGEIPYLWKHGEDALIVRNDDPEAMADACRSILSENTLAEKLSFNARRKSERFDWGNTIPQWEQILTSVALGTPTEHI